MRLEYNENDPALSSDVEMIPLNAWAQHLLTLADFPNADRFLALNYELPVHRVSPCPECGHPVVLIEFAHNRERKVVNAVEKSNGWVADVILDSHHCAGSELFDRPHAEGSKTV